MVTRISRIAPMPVALLLAIIQAIVGAIEATAGFFTSSNSESHGISSFFSGPLTLLVYPIAYCVGGFIAGYIFAFVYNVVAQYTGGIRVTLEPETVV